MPNVLLVDSTPDDRTMYAECLRIWGLNPVEIDNTADALHAANDADVILTGIRVQGPFDGLELVRRLRDSDSVYDRPIIVLTACVSEADLQRAFAAGCDVYLPKPCLPDRLVSEIRTALARYRASPSPQHSC